MWAIRCSCCPCFCGTSYSGLLVVSYSLFELDQLQGALAAFCAFSNTSAMSFSCVRLRWSFYSPTRSLAPLVNAFSFVKLQRPFSNVCVLCFGAQKKKLRLLVSGERASERMGGRECDRLGRLQFASPARVESS